MKLLPHLNQALDHMENGGKGQANKDNGKPKAGGPPANNPLAAKINLSAKGPMPPPPNNSNQTGISIAKGSYLNTNNNNA